MKKLHIKILILLMVFSTVSCKKTLDGLLNNPNAPSPASADVDLYINSVQLSFVGFVGGMESFGAQLSRMEYWGGPLYQNAYSPPSFDGVWTTAYSSIINNTNALVPLAEAQNKFIQAGMAKIMKAYTLGTMVDMFNNVPYSQAELGVANTNPKADDAASVYANVQSILADAIADLQKTGAVAASSDLFYGGSAAKWITLAKTLQLKFYMQTRLVDNTAPAKIKALLDENNLINSTSQDFQFQYGTNNSLPDSRNPHYANDYTTTGNNDYLSNYFMWMVVAQKYGGVDNVSGDPRARYYFYRQVDGIGTFTDVSTPCLPNSQYGSATFPAWYPSVPDKTCFCLVGNKGYYGRDHGDNSGTPPDVSLRTAWGIYPAGGQFDASQGAAITSISLGGLGAGIQPIWLSSYTKFLEAEAAATLGLTDNGTARALLAAGVSASISKVTGFPAAIGAAIPSSQASFVPTSTQIQNYLNLVLANYDAAGSSNAQLNIIMTEYYLALWGDGIEAYNNLRRTGMPNNLQPAVTTPTPGIFMYSFYYPSVYENRNLNAAPQKTPGVAGNHVFWDNNPDNFVK